MNKFFAMLKDSYKEAVDGWIFTVMLVLAGIVSLLVFSISYQPIPVEQAIPKMLPEMRNPGNPRPFQTVSPERGASQKLIIYQYNAKVDDVKAIPRGGDAWKDEVSFRLKIESSGGGGIEVGADNQPKKIDFKAFFRDSFTEAVRTWAAPAGDERPPYSDAIALEFLKHQLVVATRLNVTGLEKIGDREYRVTANGASSPLAWPHKPSLFFGAVPLSILEMPLGDQIHLVENTIVNGIGAWFVLMAGVIVTAGFIPNMLRKGTIDLMLTKPLARPTILLYKYIGGLIFVFVLAAVGYGGIWLAIGLRTGVWAPGLLWCVPGVTFYFAILYACSTLVGVLTRNALVGIVVTVLFWFVVWLIGTVHNALTVLDNLEVRGQPPRAARKADAKKVEKPKNDDDIDAAEDGPPKPPRTLVKVFEVLNAVTPRTKDLDTLTSNLISRELLSEGEQRREGLKLRSIDWGEVLGVAGAYIVAFLGLALLRFVTRSY
ncbi:MAG: ABC transporter permease [Planctomycetia bacterium]|nr:ABC transporter permease [Planctomycetia bacterium]